MATTPTCLTILKSLAAVKRVTKNMDMDDLEIEVHLDIDDFKCFYNSVIKIR